MTEDISNTPPVREIIRKFNMLGKTNPNSASSSSISLISRSTMSEYLPNSSTYASPIRENKITHDDIGLEIIEPIPPRENHASSIIEDYGESDIQQEPSDLNITIPRLPPLPPLLPHVTQELNDESKRTLPLSNFLLEISALVVVFILSMVLVLAIREQTNLRTTMQIVYTYIYLISIIWMIWCTFDIIKFRKQWMKLTSSAHDQEEYMDIVERYPNKILYFPDIHNTGGLFMRIGAGLFCMGSFLLTIVELAKTIEMMRTGPKHRDTHSINYSQSVLIMKSMTYIFRLIFHCVQFIFLFRYGNIIIDRYHLIARIGLIHVVIANFCTWFEAIVIETLEQLHKHSGISNSTNAPISPYTIKPMTMTGESTISSFEILARDSLTDENFSITTTVLELIEKIESSMSIYLYPCLIEYSLISVTIFYIMWRNVGKTENRSYLHFSDRHIFTVNCSRASYGLVIGGIILLLTIITLVPAYILNLRSAIPITHITELVLLILSLLIVFISFFYTTKLYYDRHAHVDIFDEILILITTVGDFAYSLFGLFASIFIESYTVNIPRTIEIAIGLLAILQTFLQSAFILDSLKRRSTTKNDIRKKPGRELITALLLINLAIWMHDSLSAKKVKLNPLQTEYYDASTWSIVQAFTSPLSIFYRFHSSVCLADIWQEIYHDHRKTPSEKKHGNINNIH